ncbi:MAG: nuclear transport factor 2 family protein [Chloroflexota bacterium]
MRAVEAARQIGKSPAHILADTPLKQLYERQVAYLEASDFDALVENNYHEDAILTSFDGIYTGRDALREYFRNRAQSQGQIDFLSTEKYVESDGAFYYEALVRSAEGVRKIYNGCVVRDGKITHHFEGAK